MKTSRYSKPRLLEKLESAMELLPATRTEKKFVMISFDIIFETHKFAPPRATGEPYIMHIFRQVMSAIKMMKRYGVFSANLLCMIILHDAVEDAEKGMTTPFMVKSQIQMLVSDYIVNGVLSLTKRKHLDSRSGFLIKIALSEILEVVIAKPFDGNDNIITLVPTKPENQPVKVREVFVFYPVMKARAIYLLTKAFERGEINNLPGWIALVKNIHRNLRRNAWKQRRRLEAEGVEVM